jgi:hypothetical protein
MRSTSWPALFQREPLTHRRPSAGLLGYLLAAAFGTFVCVCVPGFGSAAESNAPSSGPSCQTQAWPYMNKACSPDAAKAVPTRKIRLISTDRNAPATIVAPTPSPPENTPRPETRSASAPPPPDPTPQHAPPAVTQSPNELPQPPSTEGASVQSPSPPPAGSDRERNSVRTISVTSSAAAPRNDTVVVRVYHLANGRRITQYSNIPQPTPGRAGQPARVHVVPAEDATQAYAYAPR